MLRAGIIRFRPLFWPTVFTVPVVLLLLGLSFWQIERLFWKRELNAQREAALAAASTAVPHTLEEADSMEFRHRVEGLLRLPPAKKPAWFLPDNRSDLNYWFWIDLPAMAAADKLDPVALFYIDADATPNPGGWPKGGVTRIQLANDHLQYAITWFSLAVALIVVYFLFHRRNAGSG